MKLSKTGKLMAGEQDKTQRMESLRRIMDELCAPDLTIARANAIRPKLYDLLELGEGTPADVPANRLGGDRLSSFPRPCKSRG
jgi:hypothetical protein